MKTIFEVGAAVKAARSRTGDKTIGTQAEAGKFRIVRTVYANNGVSTVTPASDWQDAAATIAAINKI